MLIREILSGPEKWTKKVCARDVNGVRTVPNSGTAVSFCLLGASFVKHNSICDAELRELSDTIVELFPDFKQASIMNTVTWFNDNATWEMIDKVLVKAGL